MMEIEQGLLEKLRFHVKTYELDHVDGRVVVFEIPGRPKGSAFSFDGAYLTRVGESVQPMTDDQIRSIYAENAQSFLDERIELLREDEVVDLLDTQAYFELLHRPYPATRAAVVQRLCDDRVIDSAGGRFEVSRLAALTMARQLDKFGNAIARKAPRVIVYAGPTKLETKLDYSGRRGYAVGFRGLIEFVEAQLPQCESVSEILRESTALVPTEVVRELVANALVHQDFQIAGQVTIEIYSDRLEVRNPGEPIVEPIRFVDLNRSRNERLAALMRQFGICEEKGSGIDRVLKLLEGSFMPTPTFRSDPGQTFVRISEPRQFAELTPVDRVFSCYFHCALRYVSGSTMTNSSLRSRFDLGDGGSASVQVSNVIKDAVNRNLVKRDEASGTSKKNARYVPFFA